MKRTFLFGTVMACAIAAAATVGAQQEPSSQTSSDKNDKTVVVTGCLTGPAASATGTAGTTGTTGTTGSTVGTSGSMPSGFILTNGFLSSTSASSTAGTTASTAATTPPTTTDPSTPVTRGKSFALVGGQPSELQQYLNSKVEIRGTLDPKTDAPDATGTAASTGSTAAGAGSTSMAGMQHANEKPQQLTVSAVRQIAPSCDGGGQR